VTTSPRRPTPASRATRRSRRPAPKRATFLERNRNRLLWAGGTVVVLLLAGMAFLNSSQPAYACGSLFDPTAPPSFSAPTLEPGSTGVPASEPPLGFVQPDNGHGHVDTGTKVTYPNCPPASGKHYNASGQGPILAKLYGPSEVTLPQGWVHNLEHGAIVLLYSCPDGVGPGCTDAGQAELEALRAKWPNSPICDFPPNAVSPVITRFDQMAYPYAAVVWDVVLPLQNLDEASIFKFFAERAERFNVQELQCPLPTPTPGPTPTAGPTGTVAPTGSATPAATTAPSPS
jgi:Protein of unknown function (DUF3105)